MVFDRCRDFNAAARLGLRRDGEIHDGHIQAARRPAAARSAAACQERGRADGDRGPCARERRSPTRCELVEVKATKDRAESLPVLLVHHDTLTGMTIHRTLWR